MLSSGLPLLVNTLWLLSGIADQSRFRRALHDPATAQAARLRAILVANAQSEFGREDGFAHIASVADYQHRVPLASYDDFLPAIERMVAGEQGVLTTAPVKLFEPSSGSVAAAKLIPYTAALQREFQAGLSAWIGNLYGALPTMRRGPAYWSLTPLTSGRQSTVGGIPIGFEEDSAYLGPIGRLVETALAVPNGVKQVQSMDSFRYATLRHLLATPNLRLISVWNPTFMTLLLDALVQWWDVLVDDVAAGSLSMTDGMDAHLHAQLSRGLRREPTRARQLRPLDPRDPATLAHLWPQLALISCWADGASARFATLLHQRVPHAMLQPKGLLATEAMISLPWFGVNGKALDGAVLAVTSHFLEFVDEQGRVYLAHELQRGSLYSVVVTTGGGLYRYQLHDQIEVVGQVGATPCVRFVGKLARVSDWFGEKLNEQFVARVLPDLWASDEWGNRQVPDFALLAPAEVAGEFAYTLYMELGAHELDERQGEALAQRLDALLCENFHYDYCRRLGQLGRIRICPIRGGAATYLAVCQARGMKLGNIKPALLDRGTEWEAAFGRAS